METTQAVNVGKQFLKCNAGDLIVQSYPIV